MIKIKPTDEVVLKDLRAAVYEGVNGEFFIEIHEIKHDSNGVCLDVGEATALREFLGRALWLTESDGVARGTD